MDKPKVVTAATYKLARLIYRMLTEGQQYSNRGRVYCEKRYRDRVLVALSLRAAKFGIQMVPIAHVDRPA